MTKVILQNVGAILLSILVALLLLAGIEWVGAILHPFPADFAGTREEVMQHVANYPTLILALLGGIGWAIAMVIATWLATRLSSNRHPAFGVGIGLLLLSAAIFNMAMLPYPFWYWILVLIMLPIGIYFGVVLGTHNSVHKI